MDKLRIIHVFRAPVGGLFRHVMDVTREQAARGHDVGIFCDSSTGGERAQGQLNALSPHLTLGIHRVEMQRNPSFGDMGTVFEFNKQMNLLKPYVIHGHGSKGGLYARLSAFWNAQKQAIRVYTPHGGSLNYHPEKLISRLYMQVEGLLERKTDAFLFESDYIKRMFYERVKVTRKFHSVVVNGVTPSEFEPINHDNVVYDFLYLGELRYAKGIDTLLQAMTSLQLSDGKTPTLLLVGAGPDEAALREQVNALQLNQFVTFNPPMPIRDALAKARIMVVPSRAESLPYVILEAAAAAQPLISTNVGGIPEIFGPFGHLLLNPNDPMKLAQAMAKALTSSDEDLKHSAIDLQNYVRTRFTLTNMVDGIIDGYQEALQQKR